MPTSKSELDKIYFEYHSQDLLADKFIEDECQFHTYQWVLDHLKGRKTVLEMGYGEGNFTSELVNHDFQLTLLDGAKSSLDAAKALHGEKIVYVHELFEKYTPAMQFDCVLATHVLEHVDDPILLLKEMKNWIKDAGKIIIIVPNKESIHRQLAVIMNLQAELDTLSNRDKLVGHQRVYSSNTLTEDIIKAGLVVTDTAGFFLKLLPNSMMLNYSQELVKALNQISPMLPQNLLANIGCVAENRASN